MSGKGVITTAMRETGADILTDPDFSDRSEGLAEAVYTAMEQARISGSNGRPERGIKNNTVCYGMQAIGACRYSLADRPTPHEHCICADLSFFQFPDGVVK